MFSGSKNNKSETKDNIVSSNIIGKETTIEGNITTTGNVRIEGKFIGDLCTKAKAVLGEDSNFDGKIIAQNAEIAGTLRGIIEIHELLVLKPTAVVNGDIITKKLVFEQNAKFNGKCVMMDDISNSTAKKNVTNTKKHHKLENINSKL